MAKFHLNKEGEPGPCRAETADGCPFGGEAQHYSSQAKARQAFELSMASEEPAAGAVVTKAGRLTKTDKAFAAATGLIIQGQSIKSKNAMLARTTLKELEALNAENEALPFRERVIALKKAYKKSQKLKTDYVMPENELYPQAYHYVVAPVTREAVSAVENSLAEAGWQTGSTEEQVEDNMVHFRELLKRNYADPETSQEAVEYLQDRGWAIEIESSDNTLLELQTALKSGQKELKGREASFEAEGISFD